MRHLIFLKTTIVQITVNLDNYNAILSLVTALMMMVIFRNAPTRRTMN